jgi:hypothetical protein
VTVSSITLGPLTLAAGAADIGTVHVLADVPTDVFVTNGTVATHLTAGAADIGTVHVADGTVALAAGAADVGTVHLFAGTDVGIVGNAGGLIDAPMMGNAPTNSVWVNPVPALSALGSLNVYQNNALTVGMARSGSGNLYGFICTNLAATIIYLQFYDSVGNPTLGTGVIWTVPIPIGGTVKIDPGSYAIWHVNNGVGVGASTTPTGAGTPSVAPILTAFVR